MFYYYFFFIIELFIFILNIAGIFLRFKKILKCFPLFLFAFAVNINVAMFSGRSSKKKPITIIGTGIFLESARTPKYFCSTLRMSEGYSWNFPRVDCAGINFFKLTYG